MSLKKIQDACEHKNTRLVKVKKWKKTKDKDGNPIKIHNPIIHIVKRCEKCGLKKW